MRKTREAHRQKQVTAPVAMLEPLAGQVGVIRVFSGGRGYGDEYDWVVTALFVDRVTVELLGITQAPTVNQWRAVLKELSQQGVKTVTYQHKRDGKMVTTTRDLEQITKGNGHVDAHTQTNDRNQV